MKKEKGEMIEAGQPCHGWGKEEEGRQRREFNPAHS